jgi:hypothetical protein
MKKLLELLRGYTDNVILKDFRAGDRDQDELTCREIQHTARKQMTDSDYDPQRSTVGREASQSSSGQVTRRLGEPLQEVDLVSHQATLSLQSGAQEPRPSRKP